MSAVQGPPQTEGADDRIEKAVAAIDGRVAVLGRELRVPPGSDPLHIAEHYTGTLAHRFLQRRPNADEHTWRRFVDRAEGVLAGHDTADAALLDELLLTIDGL